MAIHTWFKNINKRRYIRWVAATNTLAPDFSAFSDNWERCSDDRLQLRAFGSTWSEHHQSSSPSSSFRKLKLRRCNLQALVRRTDSHILHLNRSSSRLFLIVCALMARRARVVFRHRLLCILRDAFGLRAHMGLCARLDSITARSLGYQSSVAAWFEQKSNQLTKNKSSRLSEKFRLSYFIAAHYWSSTT